MTCEWEGRASLVTSSITSTGTVAARDSDDVLISNPVFPFSSPRTYTQTPPNSQRAAFRLIGSQRVTIGLHPFLRITEIRPASFNSSIARYTV